MPFFLLCTLIMQILVRYWYLIHTFCSYGLFSHNWVHQYHVTVSETGSVS